MFFKIVILGTVHWKVILGNQNGSIASLQKHPFGTFIFKSVKPDIFDIVGTSLPSPARAKFFFLNPNKCLSESVTMQTVFL